MPIDWSFNRREYSLPSFDLGDVLLQRAQYQRGLKASAADEFRLAEDKKKAADDDASREAFQRAMGGPLAAPMAAAPTAPAPAVPPLGPLVKAPAGTPPAGIKLPQSVQASPARQQAAQAAIQTHEANEANDQAEYLANVQRIQSQFSAPQLSPDQMAIMGREGYSKYLQAQPGLAMKGQQEAMRMAARLQATAARERAATARTAEERRYHDVKAKQWERAAEQRDEMMDWRWTNPTSLDLLAERIRTGTDPASVAKLRTGGGAEGPKDARTRALIAERRERTKSQDRKFLIQQLAKDPYKNDPEKALELATELGLADEVEVFDKPGSVWGSTRTFRLKGPVKAPAPEAGSTGIAPNVSEPSAAPTVPEGSEQVGGGPLMRTPSKDTPGRGTPDYTGRTVAAPSVSPAAGFNAKDATRTRDNVGKPDPKTDESGSSLTGPTKGSNLKAGAEEARPGKLSAADIAELKEEMARRRKAKGKGA